MGHETFLLELCTLINNLIKVTFFLFSKSDGDDISMKIMIKTHNLIEKFNHMHQHILNYDFSLSLPPHGLYFQIYVYVNILLWFVVLIFVSDKGVKAKCHVFFYFLVLYILGLHSTYFFSFLLCFTTAAAIIII